ncbi:MAG: hypothetical protein IJ551_01780 [Prevotella sp.]|nr:hypothetical protein [Prevotella sp.]
MTGLIPIDGAWSDDANGWVSEAITLTGDIWLEVELPERGRLVIKKAETEDGPWPKALITPYTGPSFRIRIYGTAHVRYIQVITSHTPTNIHYANI